MRITTRRSRRGITVLELLIVIGIISMLGAMTASAVFKIKTQREVASTEDTIKKLASILDQHWKAVIDSARKEYDGLPSDVKSNLITVANNPSGNARSADRARLLYVKFRLKQEFPVSFEEITTEGTAPIGGTSTPVIGPDRVTSTSTPLFLVPTKVTGLPKLITAKPSYFKAVYGKSVPRELESSILLAMALEQSRAGLPAHSMETVVSGRFMATSGEFRYLVDSWGKPLQFFVFPSYTVGNGPSTTDLEILRTTNPFDLSKEVQDPSDPERLLTINNPGNVWSAPTYFQTLLHRQMGPLSTSPNMGDPVNRRLVPVIASPGIDGDIGGDFANANFKWMSLTRLESTDNIYSFRLRQTGARGD